ncbi:hypothetical protein HanRHA438_Chr15g0687641 [Helianthus annuus]|nr:hypothetical protein HanRHA438_Chr15g0687641 [Helianthus annuus]
MSFSSLRFGQVEDVGRRPKCFAKAYNLLNRLTRNKISNIYFLLRHITY